MNYHKVPFHSPSSVVVSSLIVLLVVGAMDPDSGREEKDREIANISDVEIEEESTGKPKATTANRIRAFRERQGAREEEEDDSDRDERLERE